MRFKYAEKELVKLPLESDREVLRRRVEVGNQPDYEFFDEQYADGKPFLTPLIVRKMAFENKELTSGCCWRAALSETCLAVYDRRSDDNVIPARLWIRSSMDEAEANIS